VYKLFSEIFAVNVCPVYTLLSTVGISTSSQLTVILFKVTLLPALSFTSIVYVPSLGTNVYLPLVGSTVCPSTFTVARLSSTTVNDFDFVYVLLLSTPETCGAIESHVKPSVTIYVVFPHLSIALTKIIQWVYSLKEIKFPSNSFHFNSFSKSEFVIVGLLKFLPVSSIA